VEKGDAAFLNDAPGRNGLYAAEKIHSGATAVAGFMQSSLTTASEKRVL
jgi:hypothetical protein